MKLTIQALNDSIDDLYHLTDLKLKDSRVVARMKPEQMLSCLERLLAIRKAVVGLDVDKTKTANVEFSRLVEYLQQTDPDTARKVYDACSILSE